MSTQTTAPTPILGGMHPAYFAQAELLDWQQRLSRQLSEAADNLVRDNLGQRLRAIELELACRCGEYSEVPNSPPMESPWPQLTRAELAAQWQILAASPAAGRIPLPGHPQQLWAQYKYAVMARDIQAYRRIGRELASHSASCDLVDWTLHLHSYLQQRPKPGALYSVLQHMWGYVSAEAAVSASDSWTARQLYQHLLEAVWRVRPAYLWHSVALSELALWL